MKRFNLIGDIVAEGDKWIYDYLEMPSVTHGDVSKFLEDANGEDIEIFIDSPGGLVNVGSDIYGELRAYKGKSTSYILGQAASAASVAMMGANKVIAIPTASVIIHNTQLSASGDYRDMESAADFLKEANESIINAYEVKTSMKRADLQALMDKTTRMSAQTALDYGFIDEIALKDGEKLSAIENYIGSPDIMERLGNRSFNALKIHEMAGKIKNVIEEPEKEEITTEPAPNESGGESGPVSDKLSKQKSSFNEIRKKLYS